MKQCKYCQLFKYEEEFQSANQCKKCQRDKTKAWRQSNSDYFKKWRADNPDYLKNWRENNPEKVKAIREKAYTRNPDFGKKKAKREHIAEYLHNNPCIDCGETNILTLHFDHRDRATKECSVGSMRDSPHSLEEMKTEIAKCDVRCANCHSIKTAKECNSWRLDYI